MKTGFLLFLFLISVSTSVEAEEKRMVRVYFPNGTHVRAEPATSPEARAKGLMYREKMEPDQGMLFIFETEEIHSFWMKNVRFAIDILWLDRQRRIVHMARSAQPCKRDPCPSYTPLLPSLYVLELVGGRADELGLRLNDRIEFTLPTAERGRMPR